MQRILEKLITPDDLSGNAKHVLCETADCLQVRITSSERERIRLEMSVVYLFSWLFLVGCSVVDVLSFTHAIMPIVKYAMLKKYHC